MTFMAGEQPIILQGDPSLTKVEGSLKTITKTWDLEDQDFLIEFHNLEIEGATTMDNEVEEKEDEEDLPMIKTLSRQYDKFFSTPKGLPPKRVIDHHILKIEGQKSIKTIQIWVQSEAKD